MFRFFLLRCDAGAAGHFLGGQMPEVKRQPGLPVMIAVREVREEARVDIRILGAPRYSDTSPQEADDARAFSGLESRLGVRGVLMARRLPYGSIKNRNGEYEWWFVLWRLPNFFFEARGDFDGGERDELVRRLTQVRASLGVGALVYLAYAYPGYLSGVQELVQTAGRLWPGVGTMLRFASNWQTSIVYSLFLSAAWIALFALLIVPITRPKALPGLILRLCWPIATIALFAGQFFLITKPADWLNSRYGNTDPSFVVAIVLLVPAITILIWLLKVVYLAVIDVFRGDDAHPLLAPFVTTGVSWTVAYLALSSGGQSRIPHNIRVLGALCGPATITAINVWACLRIRHEHHGDLLFLDGPQDDSRDGAAPAQRVGGPSRREVLRLAVPPAIVIGASPWWAPKALALVSTRSDQVLAYLTGGPTAYMPTSNAIPGLLSRPSMSTSVNSVAFSPSGRILAAGSGGNGGEGTVQLWNIANPARPVALGGPLTGLTYVNSVAFSPDGRTLASGNGPGMIQLWNITDPAHPVALGEPLTAAPAEVASVAFSPDGHTLASGSAPGYPIPEAIRLWNVTDPADPVALGHPASNADYEVNSVAFSPDGRTLASANASIPGLVQLWNVTDPVHAVLLGQVPVKYGTHSVAFSPDGHTLASAGGDLNSSAIELWNITSLAHPTALGEPLTGPPTPFNSVAFSPNGRTLAAGSGLPTFTAGAIQQWNVTDPAHLITLGKPLNDDGGAVAAVAFSPDGRILAGGNGNGWVDLWSVG
jgi:WD40 repeat protein